MLLLFDDAGCSACAPEASRDHVLHRDSRTAVPNRSGRMRTRDAPFVEAFSAIPPQIITSEFVPAKAWGRTFILGAMRGPRNTTSSLISNPLNFLALRISPFIPLCHLLSPAGPYPSWSAPRTSARLTQRIEERRPAARRRAPQPRTPHLTAHNSAGTSASAAPLFATSNTYPCHGSLDSQVRAHGSLRVGHTL